MKNGFKEPGTIFGLPLYERLLLVPRFSLEINDRNKK
jgi:hypothetical protein